jgi:hypothetical protein
MSKVDQILQQARALSEEEKTTVALELLASIEGADPHADLSDEQLSSDIERRAADAAAGYSKGVDWSEVEARLKNKYEQ